MLLPNNLLELWKTIFINIRTGSKNVYIDKLDDIVHICSNRYHSTIKMKPVHANSSSYTHFAIENNNKKPKSKVDDDIRILEYKKGKMLRSK